MGLIAAIWNRFRQLLGLVLPFFSKAKDLKGTGPALRRFLHVLLLVIILAGLAVLNWVLDFDKLLPVRWALLRHGFLPLLFLLLYVLMWLGWWLWKLLQPEQETSDFPDIDEAWDEALRTLDQASIDITEVPLFLVVGKPATPEEALFASAQLNLSVKQAPRRSDAPVHVYANRDGVYVTCAGACLSGRQAEILAGSGGGSESSYSGGDSPAGGDGEDRFKTVQAGGLMKEMQAVLARAREQGRDPGDLTEDEKREIRALVAQEEAQRGGGRQTAPRPQIMKNAPEVERYTARLRHVCRLIVRDRRPYCPANGVLFLVPYAGADSDDDAAQTGGALHQDLLTIREALRVHVPIFAMICDLEKAPGFKEFLERFPADQRQRRLGQRYPLCPDLPPEKLAGSIESCVQWIGQVVFPTWIYKLFRLESPGREELQTVVAGNCRLYQLLGQMRERQKRFARIVSRALLLEAPGPLLFGGCYVGAAGGDGSREQGFVAGTFRRLTENQNYVSWTDEALAEETDNRRFTVYVYVGLGVLAVVVAFLVYWFGLRG
jgi:IcmF-related N-terminal domain